MYRSENIRFGGCLATYTIFCDIQNITGLTYREARCKAITTELHKCFEALFQLKTKSHKREAKMGAGPSFPLYIPH